MQEKNEYKKLDGSEQTCIMKALYDKIATYPEKGTLDIDFEDFEKNYAGLSLCSMQGAVYLKKDITGGF